jgi:nitroimidazol reductase NimA-like FMN-containing flavoprotein (pyridoxamine 5'-phosphate oxidase superfamily)
MLGELDDRQIDHLLRSETVGRIGCHANGQTYIVPLTYVYDGQYLYGHTGAGMKVQMMRANPKVCFEVERMQDMANWQSVIVWGTALRCEGDRLWVECAATMPLPG